MSATSTPAWSSAALPRSRCRASISQNERNHALQALRDRRARVCVATDVAARGIDLPTLSLVVHVELPRDAEALQHRSGRTGRAGKKGTAVLIVPYPRRRRVDMMLNGARIDAEWMPVPTPEDIRAHDHERLLDALLAPVEIDDEDRALADRLLAEKSPEEIAAALVRAHRAAMPAARRTDRRAPTPDGRSSSPPGLRRHGLVPHGHRPPPERRSALGPAADLPPRPHHQERVGAIRIGPNETCFQIPRAIAARSPPAVQDAPMPMARTITASDRAGRRPGDRRRPHSARTLDRAARSGGQQRAPRRRAATGPPPGRNRAKPRPARATPRRAHDRAASDDPARRILVDADACPVKDEIYKVAWRLEVPVTIVSNSHFRVPGIR